MPELVRFATCKAAPAVTQHEPFRPGRARAGRIPDFNYTFKDVLTPIEFYVRGGDDRQGPYFDVVDSPTVGQMILHCEYPDYMHSPARHPGGGRRSCPAAAGDD